MTTDLYMFDTDVVSYVLKKKSTEIRKKMRTILPARICVSAITKGELLYGAKRLPLNHSINSAIERFLKNTKVLSWDSKAAEFYAEIRHQLIAQGKPIGDLDMLIAAHALSADATLVTNNVRHYSRIELPLRIETW